jgi:hypothetical protein
MLGRCSALALSALLLWIQPASARQRMTTQPLTVSIHDAVRPTLEARCRQALHPDLEGCIRQILKEASEVVKTCKVRFSLRGTIGRITSQQAPADIGDAATLEKVHQLPPDVKIVNKITHCADEDIKPGELGCAFRPPGLRKTVIVTVPIFTGHDGILWAHEYGHTTGLLHRFRQGNENLMTPCGITTFSTAVEADECQNFRAGTLQHPNVQGSGDQCPHNH